MVMADPGEFDEMYRRESEGVLVFFTRRTFDAEIALDLTAETFAHAYIGWRQAARRLARGAPGMALHRSPAGGCRATCAAAGSSATACGASASRFRRAPRTTSR